jgi:uncharacterized repeat protein (TIGR03803 family)
VVRDREGNLYGTGQCGGSPGGLGGAGVVYKVDPTGHETVLHTFTGGGDGGYYASGLIIDLAGNLYGTTNGGGNLSASPCIGYGCGVVYKVDPSGNETVLYSFMGGTDGGGPNAGVIRDSAGNLYGTAGNVFKLDASGNETVLYTFTGGADGGNPYSSLLRDAEGNLYGTTQGGGSSGQGVVYKVDTSGNETVLHTFTGGADGGQPYSAVIPDEAGNLYGTTYVGGSGEAGVLFKLKRSAR